MQPFEVSSTESSFAEINQLRQEIDALRRAQDRALQSAVFVGMTPDEAKEYDSRRQRILSLLRRLMILQEPL
jgi:hypothetical protein